MIHTNTYTHRLLYRLLIF